MKRWVASASENGDQKVALMRAKYLRPISRFCNNTHSAFVRGFSIQSTVLHPWSLLSESHSLNFRERSVALWLQWLTSQTVERGKSKATQRVSARLVRHCDFSLSSCGGNGQKSLKRDDDVSAKQARAVSASERSIAAHFRLCGIVERMLSGKEIKRERPKPDGAPLETAFVDSATYILQA